MCPTSPHSSRPVVECQSYRKYRDILTEKKKKRRRKSCLRDDFDYANTIEWCRRVRERREAMSWCRIVSLLLLMVCFAMAEWVEIPQFSDQQKVYRMPPLRDYHRINNQQSSDRRIYVDDDRFYGHRDGFYHQVRR